MRVILVDDEQLALNYMERLLLKLADVEVVGKFTDPVKGMGEILQERVDVLFLDISLPEINGIELAERILEARPEIHIVFVTAYDEYAIKAFELNALDYVLKPIRAERLAKTVDRIQERLKAGQEQVAGSEQDIKICLFKQVKVEARHGQPTLLQWRTTKAQELFLYLLQHRGRLVRKSTLIDVLWPEYETDKVNSQLYTSVYHIRKTLKPYGDHFQIVNTMEGYILNTHQVRLDIDEWEAKLAALPPVSGDSLDAYLETMKIYTGDYLQEYDYWWTESERQRLKAIWLHTSLAIADWYLGQELWEKAGAYYHNIRTLHPQEEAPYFALMKIYALQQNFAMVHRQYRELAAVLKEELNVEPSHYITEWYGQFTEKAGQAR
ncbi:response regulator [Paenibacillus macerans]|uniref:Response regulator n=1 Tax=Paenibacillus macerans TaxID=44252 RepID=A0A090ZFM8_PAEMA|nr:response regulator [Paenibacillus macerans]KFN09462.1 response regulator [Paenibacillus macerans]MCY7562384.1 response regulator [Paenibacillus macerans]MEC0149824.1 response regulator [Paenibacillus macerans]MEC0328292.1 response regulator [Paenibacillus macerans]SUA82696.1 response regulator receiver and SARP domain-containing protein [Paenibacillus macerans]